MAVTAEVAALVKQYPGGTSALAGVDLRVEPAELVALVGPNGAGKSTLLRCMVRLIEPSAGEVRIGGTDVIAAGQRQLRTLRSRVGFVFQRCNLVPRASAFTNVIHGGMARCGLRGWSAAWSPERERRAAMTCLDRVGMASFAGRRADTLSGGQAQRVAIARMLMQRPELVLADEPVSSLDPAAGVAVMELLREVAAEDGFTVIVALHQLDLARRYASRIVGLRHGRVVLDRPAGLAGAGDDLRSLYATVEP